MNEDPRMQLLPFIFNNTDDAVFITEKDGTLDFVNPAAGALFGIPSEIRQYKKIWDYVPIVQQNDELVQLFIDGVREKRKTHRALVDFINNDSKAFRLLVNLTYIDEQGGKFVIDISNMTLFLKVNDAFERYTSPQIADYVLNSPRGGEQGGQMKDVSILMSDLRGFTAVSSGMDPEVLIGLLNSYFEKMVAVIESFDGTVIEFLGDGIFVVFGAPKDDADHAVKAAMCAIEMQNALLSENERNKELGLPEMEMGIGINSGPAVVGNIGSSKKMKYGAIGYTVNLAGRVEGYTVGGQVIITDNTRALIRDVLAVEEEQILLPKGGSDKLRIYSITGVGPEHVLKRPPREIIWHMLPAPKRVKIHLLDGKIVEEAAHTASVTAISENSHYASLRTRFDLHINDNIMIDSELMMYAKVTGTEGRDYVVSFTMRPEGFTDWVKSL